MPHINRSMAVHKIVSLLKANILALTPLCAQGYHLTSSSSNIILPITMSNSSIPKRLVYAGYLLAAMFVAILGWRYSTFSGGQKKSWRIEGTMLGLGVVTCILTEYEVWCKRKEDVESMNENEKQGQDMEEEVDEKIIV